MIYILTLIALVFIYFPAAETARAQTQNEPTPLKLGSVVDAGLSGAQKHFYKINLNAGDFLKIKVEQQGVDVVLSLYSANQEQLLEVDTPNGKEGIEKIAWIVEEDGDYQLEIKALETDAKPGRYKLNVAEIHQATALERKLIENILSFENETGETKDLLRRTAPQIQLLDAEGKMLDLKEFSGKIIVLNFWATWCLPCRAEMPVFENLQKRFSKDEVVFFGINDEDEKTATTFLKAQNFTMPVLFDEWLDANAKYKIAAIPTTVIINRAGKVSHVFVGSIRERSLYRTISALK